MNEIKQFPKKPSGCWLMSGCLMTLVSTLLIVFFISLIFYSEKKLDESRAEYSAYVEEYEEEMKAYESDSISCREHYHRDKQEWNPRGHIGTNVGAAFYVVFALFMLIPLSIGLLILLYYSYRKRRWKLNADEEMSSISQKAVNRWN